VEEEVQDDGPTVAELAWAAGFFDGDGHINLSTTLSVEVTQKRRRPLDELQRIFGASTFYSVAPSGRRPNRLWELHYFGAQAAVVLQLILPYLVAKRTEAELGLQYWQACHQPRVRPEAERRYALGSHHRLGPLRHQLTPLEHVERASFREAIVAYRSRPWGDE
jgi:hypothetical protein